MSLTDYRDYPFLEELQQKTHHSFSEDRRDVLVAGYQFSLPSSLVKKLTHLRVGEGSTLTQLKRVYDAQARFSHDDPFNFWDLTSLELEVFDYIIAALDTKNVIAKLNQAYDEVFSIEYLAKKLGVKPSQLRVYFAKESSSPQPDDTVCVSLPSMSPTKLRGLAESIADPHRYQCICIAHQNCLEFYGVFTSIASQLRDFESSECLTQP